jgi:hypothetical protein
MWDLLWLLLDFVFSVGIDALLEGAAGPPRERPSAARRRDAQLAVIAVLGLGTGVASGLLAPERILPPGPFEGISLVLLPLFLGVAMHGWGRLKNRRGSHGSALATWYGGGILGACLAIGRLTTFG